MLVSLVIAAYDAPKCEARAPQFDRAQGEISQGLFLIESSVGSSPINIAVHTAQLKKLLSVISIPWKLFFEAQFLFLSLLGIILIQAFLYLYNSLGLRESGMSYLCVQVLCYKTLYFLSEIYE